MIQKILVPLDGSKLAECTLPYVEELATKCGAEVTLISVTERIKGLYPIEDAGESGELQLIAEAVGKMERQATNYLNKVAKGLENKGIKVKKQVLLGDPAEEIIIYVETKGGDLIIIASHGRSGVSRWAHGSVADRIFKAACIPVMMIRAPGCIAGI
jgi:nucleotide-binding universal stress UspA family protein